MGALALAMAQKAMARRNNAIANASAAAINGRLGKSGKIEKSGPMVPLSLPLISASKTCLETSS